MSKHKDSVSVFQAALTALTEARERAENRAHPYYDREYCEDVVSDALTALEDALQNVALNMIDNDTGTADLRIRLELPDDVIEVDAGTN